MVNAATMVNQVITDFAFTLGTHDAVVTLLVTIGETNGSAFVGQERMKQMLVFYIVVSPIPRSKVVPGSTPDNRPSSSSHGSSRQATLESYASGHLAETARCRQVIRFVNKKTWCMLLWGMRLKGLWLSILRHNC